MKTIPFRVLETLQFYSGCDKELNIVEKEQTIEITICKQFATPGYSMSVDKIVEKNQSNYNIHLSIIPPSPDTILLQVITYKTIIIEIDKKDLESPPPYVFKVNDNMTLDFIEEKGNIKKY